MPIPPLQIKWPLAILTRTINKPIQQSRQNHVSDASNEHGSGGRQELGSGHVQSSAKTSKCDFSPEEPTKHLFYVPWATKSLPAPHTALQSCSKGHTPQTQRATEKREERKAVSKPQQRQAVVCTGAPHDHQKLSVPKRKVANPDWWCLSDQGKTPCLPTALTVR